MEPADLAGRRVGIPEWAQTAGSLRARLSAAPMRCRAGDIHWVQSGVNEAGRKGKGQLKLPRACPSKSCSDRRSREMLLSGDLDAVISAREPSAFSAGDPRITRLWPDCRTVEEAYFRATGIFPIMHAIVIKSATLDQNPGLP